jgi:hypothetical protein
MIIYFQEQVLESDSKSKNINDSMGTMRLTELLHARNKIPQ